MIRLGQRLPEGSWVPHKTNAKSPPHTHMIHAVKTIKRLNETHNNQHYTYSIGLTQGTRPQTQTTSKHG